MNIEIEPYYIKQCDHEVCPQEYIYTSLVWDNKDYFNLKKLLEQAIIEKDRIEISYDFKKKPMKGALKFMTEDQQMQMLIIKSEELEIINPCFFKKLKNHINSQ